MATAKQKILAKKTLENLVSDTPKTQGQLLIESGYTESVANHAATTITESKGFKELLEEYLPDVELATKHKELLNATRLDHMTFPLEKPELTDAHIVELLKEVNCVVRKIVHSETARHVYFWAHDNKAREKAVELGYKVKGRIKPDSEPPQTVNYNFFYKPELRQLGDEYEKKLNEAIENGDVTKT